MKTIVISGARSGIGKTTLAKEVQQLLPGSVFVKIGHHPVNPSNSDLLYPMGTSYAELCNRHGDSSWMIIESNSILHEITPDCTIYLDADNPKPSAYFAKQKADMISGLASGPDKIKKIADRLGIDMKTMRRIAWLSGARPSASTAIILAGGKNTRMGKDKVFLKVNGISLVERLAKTLTPILDHILISIASECAVLNNYRIVIDNFPGPGPLSGIYSSLTGSETEYNFVMACDISDVNIKVMHKILSFSGNSDIAAPSFTTGIPEPLFAFYRKQVSQKAYTLLSAGELRMRRLLDESRTCILNVPDSSWYANLNTPFDFQDFLSGRRSSSQRICEVSLNVMANAATFRPVVQF